MCKRSTKGAISCVYRLHSEHGSSGSDHRRGTGRSEYKLPMQQGAIAYRQTTTSLLQVQYICPPPLNNIVLFAKWELKKQSACNRKRSQVN